MFFLYMTARDHSEAARIGRVLVEERLVACVNIIDGMSSVYWWEGAVQEETEAVLIAKTQQSRVDEVIERVRGMHSYDCPCIVALPIEGGNPAFLRWIEDNTR
jgi:periplasmic divalent cation tolerance protein